MKPSRGLISGVLQNRCPYCDEGRVFKGLFVMNSRCTSCNQPFLKEEGYYLGSMIAAYFFSCLTVVPVFVIGSFVLHLEIITLIGIGSVQVVILSPLVYRYSTLLWLWIETILNRKLDDSDS